MKLADLDNGYVCPRDMQRLEGAYRAALDAQLSAARRRCGLPGPYYLRLFPRRRRSNRAD